MAMSKRLVKKLEVTQEASKDSKDKSNDKKATKAHSHYCNTQRLSVDCAAKLL